MAQPYPQPCDRGVIEAQPSPKAETEEAGPAQKRLALAASILASSMAFIDGSALTVALPALRADFAADLAAVQWVLNGYVLALAALTLIGGALADAYGKRRMLTIGAGLFGLASAFCALAGSPEALVAARIAQGAAAAILTPASLALIGAVYPKAERSTAIGAWAAASALAGAGGPILGGWLTESFGWPAVFWLNPPLALLVIAVLSRLGVEERLERRGFDYAGAAILAAALAALAYALSEAGPKQASASSASGWIAAVGVAGAAGLVAYAFWERRAPAPMTPPRLFANRPFAGLNAATLAIYAALSIMFFLAPFDLVDRRGLSPTEAGLVFLPFTLGVGFLSRAFGGLADQIGPRMPIAGGALLAGLAYLLLIAGYDAPLWLGVVAPMALLGLGFAILVAPLTASVMSSVDDRDEGLASGVNNTASRIAQFVGVALAAGLAGFAGGYAVGMGAAAALSCVGAAVVLASVPGRAA
ncbi:MAG: MFS transporter [Pseudomonadota bacterium]|nr:MFS transporter [Pseudomonadota bacterium]